MAKDLEIEDFTTFQGEVEHDDIVKFHNEIDIEVYPSIIDGESFGVSVVEACACENPVVVSDVGGLSEVVEDGNTGIIVPPKNSDLLAKAIQKLVEDKDLRDKMGKAGRDRVKRLYDFEKNVEKMIAVYQRIIQK